MWLLKEAGFEITSNAEEADVLLINTCAFTLDAKRESIETIMEFVNLPAKDGSQIPLVVAGCLPQYYGEELARELPEVDVFVGTGFVQEIVGAVGAALLGEKKVLVGRAGSTADGRERLLATPPYRAYMKIAEGCDNRCTYCVIPRLRGRYRSRTIESLAAEAEWLAQTGVRELTLVAQDTTMYGIDLGRKSLATLLRRLAEVNGISWIRVMYLHPLRVDERLLEVFAEEPKLCKYLDIPIQHASEAMLRRMGRGGSPEALMAVVDGIRSVIPDVTLRTTVMVGFPGESEKDVEALIDFLKAARFDYAGVFAFSPEEGTPAFEMPGRIPRKEKNARKRAVMKAQKEISRAVLSRWVGREVDVLVECVPANAGTVVRGTESNGGRSPVPVHSVKDSRIPGGIAVVRAPAAAVGRTAGQAPEVDGVTMIHYHPSSLALTPQVSPGDMIPVLIQGAGSYDLYGTFLVKEPNDSPTRRYHRE